MSISTYSELQTAVGNWVNRSNLTSRIPEFITLAETKISRYLRAYLQEQLSTTTYTSANTTGFVALPSDNMEVLNLAIKATSQDDMQYVNLTYIATDQMALKDSSSAGKPEYWTLRDQIQLDRLADQSYTLRIHYIKKFDIASDSTNWLLTNYPDIYLFGALAEAEAYMKSAREPERRAQFMAFLRELRDELSNNVDKAELDTSEVAQMSHVRSGYNILIDH